MIYIKKGAKKKKVTKDSFEQFFKKAGWIEIQKRKDIVSDRANVEDNMEGIMKPLSEMSNEELVEYAQSLGIDTSEIKTKKELKAAIKEMQ